MLFKEKPSADEPHSQAASAKESPEDVKTDYKPIETTGFFPELPVDKSAEPAPVASGTVDEDDTKEQAPVAAPVDEPASSSKDSPKGF